MPSVLGQANLSTKIAGRPETTQRRMPSLVDFSSCIVEPCTTIEQTPTWQLTDGNFILFVKALLSLDQQFVSSIRLQEGCAAELAKQGHSTRRKVENQVFNKQPFCVYCVCRGLVSERRWKVRVSARSVKPDCVLIDRQGSSHNGAWHKQARPLGSTHNGGQGRRKKKTHAPMIHDLVRLILARVIEILLPRRPSKRSPLSTFQEDVRMAVAWNFR